MLDIFVPLKYVHLFLDALKIEVVLRSVLNAPMKVRVKGKILKFKNNG